MLVVFYPYIIMLYTLYTRVYNFLSHLLEKLNLSYEVFNNPRIFVFYKGYLQPVPYKHNMSQEGYHLFYNVDRSLFNSDNDWNKNTENLPILSLEIRDVSNNLIYDLTNFIESMRFIKTNKGGIPSFSSIVMIWATLNNMYFDPTRYKLQYIDTFGNTHETTFANTKELDTI